jgi:hypothetical protein
MNEGKQMDIKESDWVIYRLLYLILAIDPSMSKVKDVELSINYVKGDINIAFDLIKQEHGRLDTFNQFDVQSLRELQNKVKVERNYSDEEEKEFMQRRVFGLSRLEKSSGVIQEIVDKINLNMGEEK